MKFPKRSKSPQKPRISLTYFVCMYGRPELSAIMLSNVLNLQTAFEAEVSINMAIAYSTDADEEVIKKSGIDATIIRMPNTYVGKKWNTALSIALEHLGDQTHYFIKADDDGVLTADGMRTLIAAMRQGHSYIGFGSEIYLAPERAIASYATYPIPHKVMGTLKAYNHQALSAAAIEIPVEFIQRVDLDHFHARRGEFRQVKYAFAEWLIQQGIARVNSKTSGITINLWENEWQRNLDWNSDLRLAYHGIRSHVLHTDKPALFNIKLPGKNIWEYDMRKNDGQPYSYFEAIDLMYRNEQAMLINLQVEDVARLEVV